jgi:aspartyl-tRNA(Asn)/glutamyl-tRNA(Gln) amidotransferase subunit A
VQADVRAAVQDAALSLRSAGATVVPLRPFFTRTMLDGMDHFWRTRSRIDMAALPPDQRQRVLPYIRAWAESSSGMSADDLYHAFNQFMLTRQATVRATATVDYVLSPVAPVLAFAADWASPTNDPLRPLEHIAFTVPFNMSEQPAISVPWGMSPRGLPIGVQIAGPRFDDLGVLQVARALEHLRGPQPAWPDPQLT